MPTTSIIADKLDQIDILFPPERIALSKERWTRLWHGYPPLDRLPFVFSPYSLSYYDAGFTPEERLSQTLDEILVRGQFQDDFIPAFFPGCKQSTIPNMFGAEDLQVGTDWTCRPVIHGPDDIDRLPNPSMGPGTVAREWLTMQEYVRDATRGRLPIHVVDMQGPADVCGQLWGYDDFLASAYETPERYDDLMNRATDAFILFWKAQRDLLGDLFVGTHLFGWDWVPPDAGASLSADSLVMISPAFYQRCFRPCLERIGREFGGLSVHSCGDFSAVVSELCATPTVRAVNAGEMSLSALCDAGVDGSTIVIAWADAGTVESTFHSVSSLGLRADLTISGLWPLTDGQLKPVAEWTSADREDMRRMEDGVLEAAHDAAREASPAPGVATMVRFPLV